MKVIESSQQKPSSNGVYLIYSNEYHNDRTSYWFI